MHWYEIFNLYTSSIDTDWVRWPSSLTQPNPTHQKFQILDPAQPNPAQPMNGPGPWPTLLQLIGRKLRKNPSRIWAPPHYGWLRPNFVTKIYRKLRIMGRDCPLVKEISTSLAVLTRTSVWRTDGRTNTNIARRVREWMADGRAL